MARPKFPHFTPEEADVLSKFKEQNILVGRWEYDVRLTVKLAKELEREKPEYVRMWRLLQAKRIDAVCHTPETIHIIEVKKDMRASGIGQLLLYKRMYQNQFKPGRPIQLWLIASTPDKDVQDTAWEHKIRTHITG